MVKRLALIAVAVVVFVILGFWLSVGRDPSPPSAPTGDAAVCADLLSDLKQASNQLGTVPSTSPTYSEARLDYRQELARVAGAAWPNAENPDLKSVLQSIAGADPSSDINGSVGALKTLCDWS